MFEEYDHEGGDVLRGFRCRALQVRRIGLKSTSMACPSRTYHFLPKVCIRETDSNGLVYEEDIRMVVPRMIKSLGGVRASDSAWSWQIQ